MVYVSNNFYEFILLKCYKKFFYKFNILYGIIGIYHIIEVL